MFLVVHTSCEEFGLVMDYDNGIEIVNNSNSPIGLYFATSHESTVYPDTLLPETNTAVNYDIRGNVRLGIGLPRRPQDFFHSLPKDTLSIFIFHTDTLNQYPWEEVRDGYKILKRYDLSFQDIKNLNYIVPYPPSRKMKDMKMYPKYP